MVAEQKQEMKGLKDEVDALKKKLQVKLMTKS